jgi:hypothetical protein
MGTVLKRALWGGHSAHRRGAYLKNVFETETGPKSGEFLVRFSQLNLGAVYSCPFEEFLVTTSR